MGAEVPLKLKGQPPGFRFEILVYLGNILLVYAKFEATGDREKSCENHDRQNRAQK